LSTAPTLRLQLSPSPVLAGAILAAHAAAAASVLAVMPGIGGTALAALLFALGGAAAWSRALLRGARAPRSIEIAPAGEASLVRASGERVPACPVRGAGVTRAWVVLRCGRDGILVCAGMLASEPFRLLRLWALWQRTPVVAPGQLPG
jgi:hypothetical protein